ncbi:MAG: hypothetical protein ACYCOU_22805 [Sulfobacillus sp.]
MRFVELLLALAGSIGTCVAAWFQVAIAREERLAKRQGEKTRRNGHGGHRKDRS